MRFSISIRFWGLVTGWHLTILVLSYYCLREHYAWFMLVQVGWVTSLLLAAQLYQILRRPQQLIESGKSALQDRDFTVKYRLTGHTEADELARVYNQMIDTLREERTQLEEQHLFLDQLIEASPSGIMIQNFDGEIIRTNPVARNLLGADPSQVTTIDHPILNAAAQLRAGENTTLQLPNAQHFRIEMGSFVDRGFERKFIQIQALTQEVLAAEKRAYGKVIRMMAHEVNNSVGAVNALLQTFEEDDSPPDAAWLADARASLGIARERNEQLNAFMRRFADVVRLPEPRPQPVDVRELLRGVHTLFRAKAQQQNTQLLLDLPMPNTRMALDRQQMEQALINILKNALESLGEQGEIHLQLLSHPSRIVIADNGPGLSEAAAASVFSPFFTTKPQGQGVGLTLVRDILNGHGFSFSLRTEEDGWTRFVIELRTA